VSETIGIGPTLGGVPAHTYSGASSGTASTPPGATIQAGAQAPVWQPWVATHAKAQAALKTQLNRGLAEYDRMMADAQRVLDGAQAIALEQTRVLEAAAWTAWSKYMDESARVYKAIMDPALAAYMKQTLTAHNRWDQALSDVEHVFHDVQRDASRAKSLSDTSGTL